MAPEQIDGRKREIGPQTDVFAIGIVLFQLLTGKHPYHSSSSIGLMDNVRAGRFHGFPKELNLPEELVQICTRCLSADTQDRYSSAVELSDDLDRYCSDQPISNDRPSKFRQFWRWCERPERITQAAASSAASSAA